MHQSTKPTQLHITNTITQQIPNCTSFVEKEDELIEFFLEEQREIDQKCAQSGQGAEDFLLHARIGQPAGRNSVVAECVAVASCPQLAADRRATHFFRCSTALYRRDEMSGGSHVQA